MRRIRILSVLLFAGALTASVIYGVIDRRNSDSTGPQITMDEESVTVSCEAEEEELLQGIYAEDRRDGDVSESLIVESMSNFIEKGRRTISIAAFDSDSHVTKATREIIYSDYQSPRFSLSGPLKFSTGEESILKVVGASDLLDGDLTGNIKISSENYIQTDTPGEYQVTFSVTNSAGDVAQLPVTVQIFNAADESQKPEIILSQYLIYVEQGQQVDPWDYVQKIIIRGKEYEKDEDGILRNSDTMDNQEKTIITRDDVRVTGSVDEDTPGTYEILYRMADGSEEPGSVRLVVVTGA
ncbi:immunoglobulin-like domain-containing protein [Anaerostipes faecalis]|uniref:immunoglobulin-like domain-containing protein n=1 Tax=Anaerostipes faecalis TaxID=2738446 RepID=UPI003F03DD21